MPSKRRASSMGWQSLSSPEGAKVEVAMTAADAVALVEVNDLRRGSNPGERDRIFDAFVSEPAGASRPGIGLGLFIARRIVEAHEGGIE
jgi:K+-sensing histidine kinase KdpD